MRATRVRKVLAGMLTASLAVLALSCGQEEPAGTASPTSAPRAATPTAVALESLFPYTVTASNGDEVVFERPPERIVAMDSGVVETLFAIGQGHRVAGTHDFASYPPEAANIPRVGDAFNMNIEATVALETDLVFLFSKGPLADLKRAGLKVLYLESLTDDFRKVADNIRMWGRICGVPEAAEAVAADFEARVARLEEAMAGRPDGPSVFQDEGELWTPGPDTLMAAVFMLLKLKNIAHDIAAYAQISPEVIVDRDPDIVIASYGDNISGNPAFKDVSAVKDRRVYVPESDALSVAGPRYIEGLEQLARWVYPDMFE